MPALITALVQSSSASVPAERSAEPAHAGATSYGLRSSKRLTRVVEGVQFSFELPTCCWEQGPHMRVNGTFRDGKLLVSESTHGPQGAEAVVFWTSFPGGHRANVCDTLAARRVGPSAADLVAAVARTPGTRLIQGPLRVTVGGHAAHYVGLIVRKDVGCDPGFFYTWPHDECWGACWLQSSVGDTIDVWVVTVQGKRLFIEAERSQGVHDMPDIRQIVYSIRFG
jgi:hypothetical protein